MARVSPFLSNHVGFDQRDQVAIDNADVLRRGEHDWLASQSEVEAIIESPFEFSALIISFLRQSLNLGRVSNPTPCQEQKRKMENYT